MQASEIITTIGAQRVRELTDSSAQAVSNWRRIGIPSRFWHLFVAEAETRRIPGITYETLKNSRPASEAA